jgi:hypothetical protein
MTVQANYVKSLFANLEHGKAVPSSSTWQTTSIGP